MDRNNDLPRNAEKTNDILREFAGLLTDVTDLVATIEAARLPHDKSDIITVPVFGDGIEIPRQVTAAIGEVHEVLLSFDLPELPENEASPYVEYADPRLSSVSVEFVGKEKTYYLSRVNTIETAPYDHILDIQPTTPNDRATFGQQAINALRHHSDEDEDFLKNIQEIPTITLLEFNSLLMSMVYPDKERGYEMFENANLLDPKVLENIRESIRLGLNQHMDGIGYAFNSTEHTSLSYTREQGQPVSFRLSYADFTNGRTIIAQHSLETDFTITFSTVEDLPGLNGDTVVGTVDFMPTVDDIIHLRHVLQQEITATNTALLDIDTVDAIDAQHIDPADQFEKTGNNYFSPGFTQETLDRLDFDQANGQENES